MPAEQILRHENVLEDIRTTRGTRMVGSADHDVSRLVPRTTTLPVAVRLSGNAPADATRRRLHLLGATTGANALRSTRGTAKVTDSKAERHADTPGIDGTALRKWYRVPVTDSEKTTIGHNLGVGRSRVEMTKRTVIGSIVLVESHSRQRTLCHPLIQNGFRPSVIILTSAAVELLDKHRKDASSLRRFENDRGRCREVGNDALLQVQSEMRVRRQSWRASHASSARGSR